MNHVHVCLVSDQTIPNILGIYHFKPTRILFITTRDMEKKGKTDAIIHTLRMMELDYSNRHERIEVLEDSLLDSHQKIEGIMQQFEAAEFSVNLTTGTKIMSIATYEFFKDYGSKMIYIPINKNEFITPFPKKAHVKPESLSLRLSVTQYLAAYGLNPIKPEKLERYKSEALERKDLSKWIACNYKQVKNFLIWIGGILRDHRDDVQYKLCDNFKDPTTHEIDLIRQLGLLRSEENLSKLMTRSEIRYITGGWLEEFCFCELNQLNGKGIDDIQLSLTLQNNNGAKNEFDVMFTKDNALYLVECKTLDQHNLNYRDILYKIGALQQDFGLRVNSFWVTTSLGILKNNELKPAVRARADQFKTIIITPQNVVGFGDIIAEKLNIKKKGNNEQLDYHSN